MSDIASKYLSGKLNAWEFNAAHSRGYLASHPPLMQRCPSLMSRPPLDDVFIPRLLAKACREKYGPDWVFRPQYQKFGTCFLADAPVMMADGRTKRIADVTTADQVITHTGDCRQVVGKHRNRYRGDFNCIRCYGLSGEFCSTSYHPVWCRRMERVDGDNVVLSPAHWVAAHEVREGDFVSVPYEVSRFLGHDLDPHSTSMAGRARELESPVRDTVVRSRQVVVQDVKMFRDTHGYMLRVSSNISHATTTPVEVFNLEVEEEHSYVVSGLAVHNCVGQSHKLILDCLSAASRFVSGTQFEGRFAVAGTYTAGRVEAGGRPGAWEGSVGSWQAEAMGFGCGILLEELGLPAEPSDKRAWYANSDKDERIAMDWTKSREGVPSGYETKMRKRVISEVLPLNTPEEVRAALSNLKPVNLCGQVHPSRARNSEGLSVSLESGGGHSTWICGMMKTRRGYVYDMMQTWYDYYSGGYARANSPHEEDKMFSTCTTQIPEKWLRRWLQTRDCFAFAGPEGLEPIKDAFRVLSVGS